MAEKKKKEKKEEEIEIHGAGDPEKEEGEEEVKAEGPDEKVEEAGKAEEAGKEEKEKKEEPDESWEEKYTRLMAEFQNFKKRTEKEKQDVYSFANEKIMTDLLTVLDNFERGLENECSDKAYKEGMEMIFKQLTGILSDSGLSEIEAKGEKFDPNFHNAVMTDKNDEFGSGCVTEVMQKGYTLNDKVIRPSMVKVNE